jgi:hypothetical protein
MSEELNKLDDSDLSEINTKLKELGFFISDIKEALNKLKEALRNNKDREMTILESRDKDKNNKIAPRSVTRMRIWTLGQTDITTIDSFKKLLLDLGLNIQELKKEFGLLNESIQKFI